MMTGEAHNWRDVEDGRRPKYGNGCREWLSAKQCRCGVNRRRASHLHTIRYQATQANKNSQRGAAGALDQEGWRLIGITVVLKVCVQHIGERGRRPAEGNWGAGRWLKSQHAAMPRNQTKGVFFLGLRKFARRVKISRRLLCSQPASQEGLEA